MILRYVRYVLFWRSWSDAQQDVEQERGIYKCADTLLEYKHVGIQHIHGGGCAGVGVGVGWGFF